MLQGLGRGGVVGVGCALSFGRGAIVLPGGRLEEAAQDFLRALQLDPSDIYAHNNLGIVLARQGQLDDAIAKWRDALELNADYAEAHFNLGLAFYEKQDYRAAVNEFEEALSVDGNLLPARGNLALAYASLGNEKMAEVQVNVAAENAHTEEQKEYVEKLRDDVKHALAGEVVEAESSTTPSAPEAGAEDEPDVLAI